MTRPWGVVVSNGQSPVAVPITQKQPVKISVKGDISMAIKNRKKDQKQKGVICFREAD